MNNEIITLAHGGGGIRTQQLLEELIFPHLDKAVRARLDDSTCISMAAGTLAMSTDSYVVSPLFFPGGDIGRLAACGTINDIAMQGAQPTHISLALIIEEGTTLADLRRVTASFFAVCKETGVVLATGDTKVVERGKGNGIFINTTGLGRVLPGVDTYVGNARPGDAVLVSGTIGDHGIAVLSCRTELGFSTTLASDVAPLWDMVRQLLTEVPSLRCLRDPTRGGLAAALCDIASASKAGIRLTEQAVPVLPQVAAACDLLGLDVLTVANEGKAVVVCAPEDEQKVLELLRRHPLGKDAALIGRVTAQHPGMVVCETRFGGERIVDLPSGENLPRIC